MKIKVNRKDTSKDNEFPMLMESTEGKIIIATGVNGNNLEGTIIEHGDSLYIIGDNLDTLDYSAFKKFNGSITISND